MRINFHPFKKNFLPLRETSFLLKKKKRKNIAPYIYKTLRKAHSWTTASNQIKRNEPPNHVQPSEIPLPFNRTPNSETRSRTSNKIYKGLAIFSCFTRHFRGLLDGRNTKEDAEKEVVEAGKRDGRAGGRERRRGRRLIGARVPLYLNGAARWLSVSLQPPSQLQLRSLRPVTSTTGTRDCCACTLWRAPRFFLSPNRANHFSVFTPRVGNHVHLHLGQQLPRLADSPVNTSQ